MSVIAMVDLSQWRQGRPEADEVAAEVDALGLSANPFAALASTPTWTMNINHYPPVSVVGNPSPVSSG